MFDCRTLNRTIGVRLRSISFLFDFVRLDIPGIISTMELFLYFGYWTFLNIKNLPFRMPEYRKSLQSGKLPPWCTWGRNTVIQLCHAMSCKLCVTISCKLLFMDYYHLDPSVFFQVYFEVSLDLEVIGCSVIPKTHNPFGRTLARFSSASRCMDDALRDEPRGL